MVFTKRFFLTVVSLDPINDVSAEKFENLFPRRSISVIEGVKVE